MYNLKLRVLNYACEIILTSEDVSVGCCWYQSRFMGSKCPQSLRTGSSTYNEDDTIRIGEFSVAGFIFTDVQKYFSSGPLRGGDNRSHRLRYGSATGQIDRTEVLVPTEKTRLVCGSRYVHLPLGTRQDQPHPSALFLRLYHCRCCAVFENTYFSFFFRLQKKRL